MSLENVCTLESVTMEAQGLTGKTTQLLKARLTNKNTMEAQNITITSLFLCSRSFSQCLALPGLHLLSAPRGVFVSFISHVSGILILWCLKSFKWHHYFDIFPYGSCTCTIKVFSVAWYTFNSFTWCIVIYDVFQGLKKVFIFILCILMFCLHVH